MPHQSYVPLRALCFCLLIGLVLLAGFFPVRPAHALIETGKYSSGELVGFAFYKLAGTRPDFAKWITESEGYAQTSYNERSLYLQTHIYRLEEGFFAYHPDEDLITVTAIVPIRFPTLTQEEKLGRYANVKPIRIDNSDHYPFKIGDQQIAVIPQQFEKFSEILVKNHDYDNILKVMGGRTNIDKTLSATVRISFRPVKADTVTPMDIEGRPMWLMTADIGSFELWDQLDHNFLWSYSASWYKPEKTNELLDLYDR